MEGNGVGDFRVSGWPRCYLNSSSDFLPDAQKPHEWRQRRQNIPILNLLFIPISVCFWSRFHVSDVSFCLLLTLIVVNAGGDDDVKCLFCPSPYEKQK